MTSWRAVPGYEGIYAASDEGQVRIEVSRQNIRAGRVLRAFSQRDGYLFVRLSIDGSQASGCNRSVARLVLAAHVRPPATGEQANHRNGLRVDNRLENLEWVTCSENIKHAIRELGRDYRGEKNPDARLTEALVLSLRNRVAAREPCAPIAADLGITAVMVAAIARGDAWGHVGGPLTRRGRGWKPGR